MWETLMSSKLDVSQMLSTFRVSDYVHSGFLQSVYFNQLVFEVYLHIFFDLLFGPFKKYFTVTLLLLLQNFSLTK